MHVADSYTLDGSAVDTVLKKQNQVRTQDHPFWSHLLSISLTLPFLVLDTGTWHLSPAGSVLGQRDSGWHPKSRTLWRLRQECQVTGRTNVQSGPGDHTGRLLSHVDLYLQTPILAKFYFSLILNIDEYSLKYSSEVGQEDTKKFNE